MLELKDEINFKGRNIKLNLSFKNVLRAFDLYKDKSLLDAVKAVLITNILAPESGLLVSERLELMPFIFQYINSLSQKAFPYRFNKESKNALSFKKDFAAIYAAFYKSYGIDLYESDIHYIKFLMLLNNIGKDTFLYELISVRLMDIPDERLYGKDYVESIIKFKKAYSLYNKREEENQLELSIKGIFDALSPAKGVKK